MGTPYGGGVARRADVRSGSAPRCAGKEWRRVAGGRCVFYIRRSPVGPQRVLGAQLFPTWMSNIADCGHEPGQYNPKCGICLAHRPGMHLCAVAD